MNYRDYLATTTASGDEVLDDWRWLIGSELGLWYVTKAGDAFLRNSGDGSIHFLDVIGGKVQRIADNESAFQTAVAIAGNTERWLMPEVMDGQAALGMRPGSDECLSFKHPPALGGQLDPDNFETCNVLVHFSMAGQTHRQIKDQPPGTRIGEITIRGPDGLSRRPWWKFW